MLEANNLSKNLIFAKDIQSEFEKYLARIDKLVRVEGDFIVLYHDNKPYEIAKSRCDTYYKILKWVVHLSEKTGWVTGEMLGLFVEKACFANNLPLMDGKYDGMQTIDK